MEHFDREATTEAQQQHDEISPNPLLGSLLFTTSGANLTEQQQQYGLGAVNEQEAAAKQPSFNAIFNLDEDEISKLEPTLKQKLIENGENFIQQHDNLRIAHERLKAEYEQRFVELETEYSECKAKLAVELESAYMYRTKASEYDEKVGLLVKQVKKLESEKEIYISNEQKLSAINLNLEAEKRELLSLLDKKIKDNDRLNGRF